MAMMEAMGRQEEFVTSAQNLKRDEQQLEEYQEDININSSKNKSKQTTNAYKFAKKADEYN